MQPVDLMRVQRWPLSDCGEQEEGLIHKHHLFDQYSLKSAEIFSGLLKFFGFGYPPSSHNSHLQLK